MNIRNLICIKKKIRTDCLLECKCHFHNYDACDITILMVCIKTKYTTNIAYT